MNNYDDDGDGEISIAESDNITMVNCSGKGVTDLTGLESCTNLMTLNCSNNNITTINLPNLKQLRTLTCNDNPIEHINLDNCAALEYLNLQGVTTNAISGTAITLNNYTQSETLYFTAKFTPFTSFTVRNTPTLTTLEFYGEFTDVAVTNNTALTSLAFYAPVDNATLSGNSVLEGVDVSSLLQLETLDVQKCKLQSLDVTKNVALTSLVCNNNELTTLDVSNNTALVKLYCNKNQLPKINVTSNTTLQEFDIADNLLSVLNIRNNAALTYLNVNRNADLLAVDVQANTVLKQLYASGLAITDLDLTNNTNLELVYLFNDNLTAITGLTTNTGLVIREKSDSTTGYAISLKEKVSDFSGASWGNSYKSGWRQATRSDYYFMYINKTSINNILSIANMSLIEGTYWTTYSYYHSGYKQTYYQYFYMSRGDDDAGSYQGSNFKSRAVYEF